MTNTSRTELLPILGCSTGQAILAKDLSNAPWTEAQAIDPRIYRRSSVLAAPVIMPVEASTGTPARTLAVIVAVSLQASDAFSEEDRVFLEIFGRHIEPFLTAVLAAEKRDTLVATGTASLRQAGQQFRPVEPGGRSPLGAGSLGPNPPRDGSGLRRCAGH